MNGLSGTVYLRELNSTSSIAGTRMPPPSDLPTIDARNVGTSEQSQRAGIKSTFGSDEHAEQKEVEYNFPNFEHLQKVHKKHG